MHFMSHFITKSPIYSGALIQNEAGATGKPILTHSPTFEAPAADYIIISCGFSEGFFSGALHKNAQIIISLLVGEGYPQIMSDYFDNTHFYLSISRATPLMMFSWCHKKIAQHRNRRLFWPLEIFQEFFLEMRQGRISLKFTQDFTADLSVSLM